MYEIVQWHNAGVAEDSSACSHKAPLGRIGVYVKIAVQAFSIPAVRAVTICVQPDAVPVLCGGE